MWAGDLLIALAGLALLVGGGEGLVRGAVGIARLAGISPIVIGVTIVSLGTTAPELVVSVDASLSGAPGIALGNAIGSSIANIMLILGATALLRPIAVHPDALRRDSLVLLGAAFLTVLFALNGTISRLGGAILLGLLGTFVGCSLWWDLRGRSAAADLRRAEAEEVATIMPPRPWVLGASMAGGLALLIAGSRLTVVGATAVARDAGVPEDVIGLTLIAVGTSLPELATCLVAAWRGHSDIALGNIIGANIVNLLGVLGAAALAAPLTFSERMVGFDVWVLPAITLLLIVFMATGHRIQRREGAALLVLYAIYVGVLL